ncbi:transcriptional regulator [Lactobacillus jensenii]|uniref:transcriptional regulator n=1 Tax=Lactobacillus jensenii TaxID=109790 RepID=UPI001F4379A7|nr:transcriptional regulator [Lactobacillus jensenii]MCF1777718.1 transcriptional regulator [Lactobacillus jensenii]
MTIISDRLKRKISQVFINEVSKNGFRHTSVAKIMKIADIRRQTFYDNFLDKYDLLYYVVSTNLKENIDDNIDYLNLEEIIMLLFYDIELHAKFYRSVLKSQTEVDIVSMIALHLTTLLFHILEEKGLSNNQKAKDFVETYCLGMTYTMTANLYHEPEIEYDELAKKWLMQLNLRLKIIRSYNGQN